MAADGGEPPLQLDEQFATQEREWRFQVVGVALLTVGVLAGVAGLFGHGPLSWETATSPSGRLEVASPRFGRLGGTATLTIRADAELATGSTFRVVIDQRYLDHLGTERILPEPDVVESDGGRTVLVMSRGDGDGDLEMTIDFSPDSLWSTAGEVRVGDESVAVDHFVFP